MVALDQTNIVYSFVENTFKSKKQPKNIKESYEFEAWSHKDMLVGVCGALMLMDWRPNTSV